MIPWWAVVAIGGLEIVAGLVGIGFVGRERKPTSASVAAWHMLIWGGFGAVLIVAGLTGIHR